MAKGDVTLKFDAQTAQFVQELLKAKSKLDEMADSTRKIGAASEEAGKKGEHAMEKFSEGAKELAGELIGVTSAVGAIVAGIEIAEKAYEKSIQIMEGRAEGLILKMTQVSSALANAGQGADSGAAFSFISSLGKVGGKLVNPNEASSLFANVSQTVGNTVSVKDKESAMVAGLMGRAAGMDMTGAGNLANIFVKLARERASGEGFQNATDENLQDIAYKLQAAKPAGLDDREARFLARAKNKDQAIQLLLAAANSDENARTLSSIQNAAEEDITRKDLGDPRKRRLFAVAKEDRLNAMLEDPSLAPPDQRLALENLMRATKRIPATPSLAEAAKQFQNSEDPNIAPRNDAENTTAFNEQLKLINGPQAAKLQAVKEARRAIFKARHPYLDYFMTDEQEGMVLTEEEKKFQLERDKSSLNRSTGVVETPITTDESLKLLQEVVLSIKDLNLTVSNGALKNNTPNLGSNKDGAK